MSAEYNDTFINELTTFFKRRNEGITFIQQYTLDGDTTDITFSAIVSSFTHLFLECRLRTDRASDFDGVTLRFNGDSGSTYDLMGLSVNTGVVTAGDSNGIADPTIAGAEAANSRADNYAPLLAFVPFYKETDAEKHIIVFNGAFRAEVYFSFFATWRMVRWQNTAAITSIAFRPELGTNFVAGSKATLYGLK